jgi:predicted RNase H-like HicB family nuclease
MKYKNTLNKGSVRYIIFKEDNAWYGVALEFNIVEEGDDPVSVMASLFEAIQGYIETAKKFKMRPMPLNQKPDAEYEELWNKLQKGKIEKTAKPEQVFSFGYNPFQSTNQLAIS